MSLELLKKSLQNAVVIKKGDYPYLVHPLTDGIPEIDPALLEEICEEMLKKISTVGEFDCILTIEAMGIPIATALSLKLNIPLSIIRKRSYRFPEEISVLQETGYSKSNLYINGITEGKKVIVIDDILSTGGTLRAIIQALTSNRIKILGVFIVIDKGKNLEKIRNDLDIRLESLITIDVEKRKNKDSSPNLGKI